MPNFTVENAIAVLAVADVPASIRFYREKLGFELDWTGDGDPPHIASVSRDGHAIMIHRRQSPRPGLVWIGVSDLVPLWDQVEASREIIVVQEPTNQSWALEMQIQDPDGNVLWFGMEPLPDVPFGHEPNDSQLRRNVPGSRSEARNQ
jgi:catechol 2,3-dioxygenase-like lactoylglutathione lyase family enzyme